MYSAHLARKFRANTDGRLGERSFSGKRLLEWEGNKRTGNSLDINAYKAEWKEEIWRDSVALLSTKLFHLCLQFPSRICWPLARETNNLTLSLSKTTRILQGTAINFTIRRWWIVLQWGSFQWHLKTTRQKQKNKSFNILPAFKDSESTNPKKPRTREMTARWIHVEMCLFQDIHQFRPLDLNKFVQSLALRLRRNSSSSELLVFFSGARYLKQWAGHLYQWSQKHIGGEQWPNYVQMCLTFVYIWNYSGIQ